MKLFSASLSSVLLCFLLATSAQARPSAESDKRLENRHETGQETGQENAPGNAPGSRVETTNASNDSALVNAVNSKRNVDFLEASGVTVIELLADDTQGLPHEKFIVRLSNGATVLCVFNLDMGQRIPLKVGDIVDLGGQFKWTNVGALMHWLHADTQNRRPDGYVDLNGKRYGLN